jgi:transcriptional regulator with PAS, ATPase and Fis domain
MNEALRHLLACKSMGTFLFDIHFSIVKTDTHAAKIIELLGHSSLKDNLLSFFPELVGNEQFIQGILNHQRGDFRLDYVNRTDESGNPLFLNLLVLPDEKPGHGILILEEVTAQARALQERNQQKYELYLYERDPQFRKKFLSESILGNSEPIRIVRKTIHKICKVPTATVLLLGETGCGKNLAARVIHYSSMSTDAPFVDINCAALPEHLIESELFGYEKGAFTHAIAARRGLFEEAQNGTIFLDEIGDLPLNLQAKLLSVLETKKFRRLGSNTPIEVDARIISATNRDLFKEVEKNSFREDLYYRLNVVSIKLPPLREMGEDIILLAGHLLKIFNIEFKKQVKGFTADARQVLLNYPWPGNVRELSNCLERAMIFIEKDWIEGADLAMLAPKPSQAIQDPRQWVLPPNGIVLEDVERHFIVSALTRTGNNKSEAARLLGLSRDTLRYRLEKYQLG